MLLLLTACVNIQTGSGETDPPLDSGTIADSGADLWPVTVTVTVDGAPQPGARVMQAGTEVEVTTDADGIAQVEVDPSVRGERVIVAAWPGAWNLGAEVDGPGELLLAMNAFDTADNPDYAFDDPGAEAAADTNSRQCGHCHLTLHRDWLASVHASAAKNPTVQATYQGLNLSLDAATCEAGGGRWGPAVTPGTGATTDACHVASGVTEATGGTGGCADCHAPGIGGAQLAGHDLLEASGVAYDYGVHCDVCHRVQSVEERSAPGVGGWLHLLRPLDPSPSRLLGLWHPLTFGPYVDVINPIMGAVASDDFHEAALCGGCHELEQPVLVSGVAIDVQRWPSGTLPIMSTFAEWKAGPMNPAAPCQSCHMPPAPEVGNSADLGNEFPELTAGVAAGWWRAPGSVRKHSWVGPREPDSGMLELAAFVDAERSVVDGVLTATVTVQNVGPGHAIPTGEPLRNLILRVSATCGGIPLVASGGDVVPEFGGAQAVRSLPETLDGFEDVAPGDRLRFVRVLGMIDYSGPGAFGDGSFDTNAKGLPELEYVGEAEVVDVAADGTLTLDPFGVPAEADTAFLIPGGDPEGAAAGLPGFGFARVLVGADGTLMVPHALAVDVKSDNRLSPGASFTTTHRFVSPCAAPEVQAELHYRQFPWEEAQRYGWNLGDRVMAQVAR